MTDFINLLLHQRFLQYALLAGVLSSIVCGVMGTFVVLKRVSMASGGIAHAIMGGVGIAYFMHVSVFWGAFAFAVLTAVLIGWIRERAAQREDTLISALWAIGMALGVIFMYLTPGYNVDLFSFMFGNIIMVSKTDLLRLAILSTLVIGAVILLYRQFLAVSFDAEFAALRGVRSEGLGILMLILIAVTVVILIQAVGLILVIAMLTLPAAFAGLLADTPMRMMAYAMLTGLVCNLGGLLLAFLLNFPPGATVILLCGIIYLLGIAVISLRRTIYR